MSRPTLTIDLDAIATNWHALNALSGAAETAAAVKADGYGCGAAEVAGALVAAGCRTFFVATLEEGIALRAALPDDALYVLNGVVGDETAVAKAYALRPCLNDLAQMQAWRAVEGGACALQIDTGMCRLGLPPGDLVHVPKLLPVDLVMSHLACADDPKHPANGEQLEGFRTAADYLEHAAPDARRSLAATGGTLLGSEFHFDMVRCGIGIYGGQPFAEANPVVTLEAPIVQIRDIPEGQSVGYGWTHTAKSASRLATLPLGYADGLHRALSNLGRVFINGKPAPIAGRVSMDLLTVDISRFPNAQVGDMVEIIGKNQTVDALATAAATIGYEILTSLGSRYARRYKSVQLTGT